VLGQNLPIGGGAYLRIFPLAYSQWGLRAVDKASESAMMYLHPWEIDVDQPRLKVGMKSRLRQYTGLNKMEQNLEALIQEFEFAPASTVFSTGI
jgi:hypothetical protein